MTPEAAQHLPKVLVTGNSLPDVLIAYQKRLMESTALYQVTICEKSRRIGMTWAIAADAVLTAGMARSAGGMDVMYVGYNLDMAREFIDTSAMWAKAFLPAATEVEEFLFKDQDEKGADKDIQAFRITFASGYEIIALTSKPRSLRGRQGYLIFDEAAFHDDLAGMMKAGLAFLMWGGKILVISTHDGDTNPFAELVNDSRAGRKPYNVLRVTFDDAIEDGLYERVAMMLEARGQKVPDKEKWISDIRAFYGDDAAEELDVIPAQGTGTVLSGALIEQRMDRDVEVLRWERPPSFGRVPLHVRQAEAKEWCEEMLAPRLENLPALRSFFGEDFGRVGDLTVIWPLQMQADLVRRPPFVVELSNIPFEQQKQVLFFILRRLPNFMAGAMDASGNGAWLAEATADEFGHDRIAQVKLSVEWYRENMPRFVAAFQDGLVVLPKDADVLGDHRLLRKVDGVVRVPALRTQDLKNRDKKRHGDSAIAHAMAYHASLMEVAPIEFMSSGDSRRGMQAFQDSNESGGEMNLGRGYGVIESGSNWRGY